jgi:hypothetical protein
MRDVIYRRVIVILRKLIVIVLAQKLHDENKPLDEQVWRVLKTILAAIKLKARPFYKPEIILFQSISSFW